jgi:hypothetical protein
MLDKAKDIATTQQRRQRNRGNPQATEAPPTLKEVDESEILRNASERLYPTFDRSIKPALLGGGFGIVFEVKIST